MPTFRRYLWFIPLLLTLLFGLRRSWSASPSDFAGYYYGSRALIHGQFQQAYDMALLNDRIAADGYRDVFVSYTPFPPFTSLVFAPFLIFPMNLAKVVFNCLSIALFLFTLSRFTRYLGTPPYLILALPFIFFIPLLNNLAFGQSYLLLFTLLAEGYLAYRKQQRIRSSLLWATAILFKLFPAFLFLFLLLRRQYRDAIYLGLACAILLLPAFFITGIPAWQFYTTAIMPRLGHGELNDSYTIIFQSAFMLFKRAFSYDQLLNPQPLSDNPWLFTLSFAIFKSVILTTAALLTASKTTAAPATDAPTTTAPTTACGQDDFFPFSVWIAAIMLISPNGSSYSLVLLVLPLLSLAHRIRVSPPSIAALLLLDAACTIPVTSLGSLPLSAQFPRLYLLILFYFLLCRARQTGHRTGHQTWNLALITAITAIFFALDIRGNLPDKDPSSYILTKEEHLLIDGFSARNNRLIYSWRDDKGSHDQITDYPVNTLTKDGVAVINNQIWYHGKQLTSSSDRKAKPALANGDHIIYLSDKHRGFEFYTLRTIGL